MSIVGPWGRRLVRALSCISMIVVLVLILARVFRPDGGLDIDEIEQAEVSVLTELLEQRFLDSKSVDISRGGSKVSSDYLQKLSSVLPRVSFTTASRVQVFNGERCERKGAETEYGKHFDVRLVTMPLFNVMQFNVSTGSCGYELTVAKLFGTWKTISVYGGCVAGQTNVSRAPETSGIL
jgi:hypothetical protein